MSEAEGVLTTQAIHSVLLTKAAARTVVAPLDRIKFLLQSQHELVRLGRLDKPFCGVVDCVRRLIHEEGWQSFFRGNTVHLASILPTMWAQAVIGIPVQSAVYDCFVHTTPAMVFTSSVISSGAGALAVSTISYPFDMLHFRLSCDVKCAKAYSFKTSLSFILDPLLRNAPHEMYRGLAIYLVGSLLYRISYLTLYNVFFSQIPMANKEDTHLTSQMKLALQAIGSYGVVTAATVLLYPADTVRRRMMMTVNNPAKYKYATWMDCVSAVVRKEGLRGLFRGAGFTVVRGAVTTTLALGIGLNL